jgi:hypothetical protein
MMPANKNRLNSGLHAARDQFTRLRGLPAVR